MASRPPPTHSHPQKKVLTVGKRAFGRSLPFSELDALAALVPYVKVALKFDSIDVVSVADAQAHIAKAGESEGWSAERLEASEPGSPSVQFWNTK